MTEPSSEPAPTTGPPAPAELAADQPASTSHWLAPTYDLHPPAEAQPVGPDGPSHFGGPASDADREQTTVLPVVDGESPLVWPELHGTPLISASVRPADDLAAVPSAAPPAAVGTLPAQRARATQSVTCPQCGTVVLVDPQSRSSLDFCPNPTCDFPLFWVKSAIIPDGTSYGEGSAHRRLPGTAGRAITASMACPHCTEPNPISGVVCVRCGLDLRPIAVAPPPPPPPPPPMPEPVYIAQEIDEPVNWWLIILVGALIVLFFAALTFVAVVYLLD